MADFQTTTNPLPHGKPSKAFDTIGFLKRYGLFVLIIGSFLFTLSVPVVLLISKPNYEAKALIRIDPVIPSLITKSEDPSIINYYQDYARTQAKRMMQFEVLKRTVEKLTPEEKAAVLPPALPADKCAHILGLIIKVTPMSGTHLIQVSVSSPKRKGLATLLNTFMEVFLEKVRTNTEMQDNERLTFLRNKQQGLTAEITNIEEQLSQLTSDIYTASFSEDYNLASKKTEELQKLYVRTFEERVIAENNLNTTLKANELLESLSLDPMVEELVIKDQSLDFTSSWTYQQLQQMRSSTDGLTKSNPDRIYVEQRMEGMQSYEKKLENEIRDNARTILYGKRDYDLQKDLILAENRFEKASNAETEVLEKLKQNQEEGVRISVGMHLGQALDSRIEHKRALLNRIDTRIHELEVEGKAPLRISIESQAREPDSATGSNVKKLMLIFFVLSFGSTGGLFLAYDFFDNRIRRPEDIQHGLGHPPAAVIPDAGKALPVQEIESNPVTAGALRSLAVRLKHEQEKHGAGIILFTGIEKGVGSSSIAFNTTRALGTLVPKVLFIDADTSNRSTELVPEIPADAPGLLDILSSSTPWKTTIRAPMENNMDIMPTGNATGESIPQQKLANVLKEVRKEYDIICIDSAPLKESDLTESLVTHTDITTLIALGDSTLFQDLRTAAELLVYLNAPVIAPVLNWGGCKRSLSIDKLLEKRPEFLNRVNTEKLETLLGELPSTAELLQKTKERARKLLQKAQEIAKTLLQKIQAKIKWGRKK